MGFYQRVWTHPLSLIPPSLVMSSKLRCFAGHDHSVMNLCQPLQFPSFLDDGKVQWIDSVIQRIVHHLESLFRSGLDSALLREIQGFGQDYGWDYDSCLSRIKPGRRRFEPLTRVYHRQRDTIQRGGCVCYLEWSNWRHA